MARPTRALTGKPVLVLGADTEFAQAVCQHLASRGAELLLQGEVSTTLEELDEALSQSELHRFAALPLAEVTAWLQSHAVGVRDAVVFLPSNSGGAQTAVWRDLARALEIFAPHAHATARPSEAAPPKVLLVRATRPDGHADEQGTERAADDLARALAELSQSLEQPVTLNAIDARAVVSRAFRQQLEAEALAEGVASQVLLERYALCAPHLTAERLGQLVETLLGPFSDHAHGQVYRFDGSERSSSNK